MKKKMTWTQIWRGGGFEDSESYDSPILIADREVKSFSSHDVMTLGRCKGWCFYCMEMEDGMCDTAYAKSTGEIYIY